MAALTTVTSQLSLKQEELGRAVDSAGEPAALRGPTDDTERRLEVANVEAETARARMESALSEQLAAGLVRVEQQLAEGLAAAAEAEAARRWEHELRVREAIDSHTAVIEAQQSDLRAALESKVQQHSVALERLPEGAGEERLQAIEAQHAELRAALDSNVAELRSVVAGMASTGDDMQGSQETLSLGLEGVLARVGQLQEAFEAEVARSRSEAVASAQANVELVNGAESRAGRIEAQHAELWAALESSVERLRTALEQQAAESRSDVARVELSSADARRSQEALSRGLESILERMERVEATAGQDAAARRRDLLDERLAGLAAAAEAGSRRLQAVEAALEDWPARVEAGQAERRATPESTVEQREWELEPVDSESKQKAGGQLPEALESLRRELQTAFSEAVAAVQSSSAVRADEQTTQLETLKRAVAERTSEVSDLFDLQAALDSGMSRLASDLAAARGLADGSSLGPLRSDVKALKDQIAAQNKALAALKRTVETLGRSVLGRSTAARARSSEEWADLEREPKGTSRR